MAFKQSRGDEHVAREHLGETRGVIPCLSYEQRNSAIDEFSSNICELVFYAIRAKDKFSIIDENVRRSSRTFGVRQECSVFQEEHRIRSRLGIL